VYEWRYLAGVYSLYVDGQFIDSDEDTFRPTGFFFGHTPATFCPWTTQEIDFVSVVAERPVPAQTTTWGRLKAARR